jgi:hypothetical protein
VGAGERASPEEHRTDGASGVRVVDADEAAGADLSTAISGTMETPMCAPTMARRLEK